MQISEKALRIAEILDSKKADDIIILDVRGLTIISDYFVVASASNVNHTKTLAEEVEMKMAQEGQLPLRSEGETEGRWIVIDYGDVLVHIFHKDERSFYQLERLWEADNNFIHYPEQDEDEDESEGGNADDKTA